MVRSRTRVVETRAIFPHDDALSALMIIFLARTEELGVISERLHILRRKRSVKALPEQLFLVRSAAIAIHELGLTMATLRADSRFDAGIDALDGRRAEIEKHCEALSHNHSVVDHVRKQVGAHFDRNAITRALANTAEVKAKLTLAARLGDVELDHVHLVLGAAMLQHRVPTAKVMTELVPVLKAITASHEACVRLIDPVLSSYDTCTGRMRFRR